MRISGQLLQKIGDFTLFTKMAPVSVRAHEYLIVSKFRNDRVNIVDFLIKAYFCQSTH